jgi:hypothetical protein
MAHGLIKTANNGLAASPAGLRVLGRTPRRQVVFMEILDK